jgi:hypothetical protein
MVDAVYGKVVSVGRRMSITLTTYAAFIPNMQADMAAGVDRWLREQLVASRWQMTRVARFS